MRRWTARGRQGGDEAPCSLFRASSAYSGRARPVPGELGLFPYELGPPQETRPARRFRPPNAGLGLPGSARAAAGRCGPLRAAAGHSGPGERATTGPPSMTSARPPEASAARSSATSPPELSRRAFPKSFGPRSGPKEALLGQKRARSGPGTTDGRLHGQDVHLGVAGPAGEFARGRVAAGVAPGRARQHHLGDLVLTGEPRESSGRATLQGGELAAELRGQRRVACQQLLQVSGWRPGRDDCHQEIAGQLRRERGRAPDQRLHASPRRGAAQDGGPRLAVRCRCSP